MSELELPPWAEELRNRYLAGEASMFLLHGNVRDLHPWKAGSQETYHDLRGFLEAFLSRTRDIVAYYNVSQGLCFTQPAHQRLYQRVVDARRMLTGSQKTVGLPRTATEAVPAIEELITEPSQSSGVIIDFFEMIAPNGDVSFMVHDDKANLVSLQRWSSDPAFVTTDNLVILVTEHLSDVNRRILASPQLSTIQIPFPEEDLRERFIRAEDTAKIEFEMDPPVLAKVTAGLSLIQIRSLLRGAEMAKAPVTFKMVSARKKQIIEQECHGLVEFVAPHHNFSHVGGMERIKRDLMLVADGVKKGQTHRVPMGMIFVGPMGTGKTFVAEAFASESGLTCLKLKNFRDKWVGSTEANLEKVLDLVDALGYVLLIVDEADRSLSAGSGSDGGVNSRVIARLKEFMSDTSHRGRVVILMMTNRPDKLDTDLKRPGRFDVKIPFFFPEESEERKKIFQALVRKNKLELEEGLDWTTAVANTEGYSGAELESVLITAANLAADDDSTVIGQAHMDQSSRDVIPSRDTRMLEFMEMLAVFECSAKRMLPDRFQGLDTDEVHKRLDLLRIQLGSRAVV
ncbi:MAG: ATP-binding protein [Myxococcota bacterium]